MLHDARPWSVPIILITLALQIASAASASTEVTIDGRDNAIFGGGYHYIELPAGATSATLSATGTAMATATRHFGSVVVEFYTPIRNRTLAVLPAGGQLQIDECTGWVSLFFVDDSTADNSGSFAVVITPGGQPPMAPVTVDAVGQCVNVSRAATVTLPPAQYLGSADGNLQYAYGGVSPYVTIGLMFDTEVPYSQRTYGVIPFSAPPVIIDGFPGGTLHLFVCDPGGHVVDNSGTAVVTLDVESGSPVEETTWGGMKTRFGR